jgi:hypothetical protein
MLMPKEFEIKSPLNELTDADLADLIAGVQSVIAGGVALAPAGGERLASKPLGFALSAQSTAPRNSARKTPSRRRSSTAVSNAGLMA